MKKTVLIFMAFILMLCSVAVSESSESVDVTYRTLYNVMIQAMKDIDEGETDKLVVKNATVWKINNDTAGFSFQGSEWLVYGEADMQTGIITRLLCRLPYTEAGLIMTYMTTMVLSEEKSTDAFIEKYVGEKSLLNGKSFPHYENTLDAGNASNIVYEFTRLGSISLENENNRCDMRSLIDQIQTF